MTSILSEIVEFSKDKDLMQLLIQFVLDTLLNVANTIPTLQISVMAFLAKLLSVKWRLFFPGGVLQMMQQVDHKPQINHMDVVSKIIDSFIAATTSS